MTNILSGKTAIAGIGATEFSTNSGRSENRLAVECVTAALKDAGLSGADVDGICTYTMDNNRETEIFRMIGGKELKMFARTEFGGGATCGPILHAAMAITTGVCDVVVVYRAMNERSGYRFGSGGLMAADPNNPDVIHFGWYMPFGLMTPASWIAMCAQRYMHEYGATKEDFGHVSVAARDFASTNPAARFYEKPLTLEEHQNARPIVDPLCLYDCCMESDGGVALVITSAERARDLKKPAVIVKAAAQGIVDTTTQMTPFHKGSITGIPEHALVARQLYEMSGLGPQDIQVAELYDHFTPWVLAQLEEFGFCERGEAKDFVRAGHHARGGKLPVNTHGGLIGEAYIHGLNSVAEAVRQVRGDSVNQVDDVVNVLATAGTGVPSGAVILGTDA